MASDVKTHIESLRGIYGVIGEMIQLLNHYDKNQKLVVKLQRTAEEQKQRIADLEVIVKGYQSISGGNKVDVCPECLGSGAYIIAGDVEECDRCDTNGWILLNL